MAQLQVVHGSMAKFQRDKAFVEAPNSAKNLVFWRYFHDHIGDSYLLVAYTEEEAKQLFYKAQANLHRKMLRNRKMLRKYGDPGELVTADNDESPVQVRRCTFRFGKFDIKPEWLGFVRPGIFFDPEALLAVDSIPFTEHYYGE